MTDLTKMSKEELVTAILGPDVELQGEFAKTHRAELLRRLGAAPSEGIKPGLLGVLLKAVDDGEANWRKGGCLENGCACWTEHVKEAIRAALSPARSEEPSAPQTSAEPPVCCNQPMFDVLSDENVHQYWQCSDCEKTSEAAAPQPVSGAAPEWIMKPCPKELAAIMSSPADWLITRVDGNSRHTLYFSNEELEKLCQGYLQVIPLERLKDLRATRDAPKVEKIARQLSQKFGFHSSRVLTYEGALEFLRPYFPPASQTPDFKTLDTAISDLGELAEMLRDPQHRPTGFDCSIAMRLDDIRQTLKSVEPATPASTARTDGWVSVEERLPEDSELVLLFQRDGIASVTTFGARDKGKWLDYNNTTDDYPNEIRKITHWQPLPAAPGSVPQAPVAANTRCSEHKVFYPACADCWKEYYKSPAFGVPQAEPPKEEKP